ncbi:site-specific integrase [Ferrimonas senticii]|uniref:site-specific integrase n=1 Tax=Ferrimonas senticii TaxID=394566 RepID=UPI0003FA1560|nr:site-specific integrase [Ferrimonas senticii]
MANIRVRPNGIIQYDLHIYGQRFRETSKLPATPNNLKKCKAVLKQINAQIALGTFSYRDFFPKSKKIAKFEALERQRNPEGRMPYFDSYAREWFQRQLPRWQDTYARTVEINLDKYLFPRFGNTIIDEITLVDLERFRQTLTEQTKANGTPALAPARINNIVGQLISVMGRAADELQFRYPFTRYKPLRQDPADSKPLTIEEVKCFLTHVTPEWHDYYVVRFFTGMRSCEVHGLQLENIDFDHKLIRIRHNWVKDKLTVVKTRKSRRDLRMTEPVYQALTRIIDAKTAANISVGSNHERYREFVFTTPIGTPLSTHYVSRNLWYPTLKRAGLAKRRPYETRHTAAVLHIAAHENPAYISQMLGHSSTKLLFDVYAPYVANATGRDGNAFTELMSKQQVVRQAAP